MKMYVITLNIAQIKYKTKQTDQKYQKERKNPT
jgi:hypothetical protein